MADAKMPEKLGRYEVIRELGKGAMGVVYEGRDPNIGRRVAIKTTRREVVEASGMADEMMERFLREAQAAGALSHPNIITIYDAAEENGIAYIAMEYLEGGDLGDVMESKRRLGMDEIVEIGASICEALAVAHDRGVVHRDIKPANILTPTGQPLKVADFGIAHVSDSNLTQDGALIGTPHYMSPEQFMGQKLDGRSDLFSVGNILYELTTGEKPFGGEALSTVMHHVIKTDPVSPAELNFNVPDALAQVILKALSKRPANRYRTGREMAAALRESLKENPDPAILDPSQAAALGATVPGGTPAPAQDATVISAGPPNEDLVATVPGARPSSQATTIAESGPDATVPGGPPAGDTQPGNRAADVSATVPGGAPPAPSGAPDSPAAPGKGLLVGGGIAAAVVVVGLGALMLGGGGDETPATPAAATPTTSPSAEAAAANFYTMVSFNILRAKNLEDYRKFDAGEVTLDDLDGKLDDVLGPFPIELVDADGATVTEMEYQSSGDFVEIPAARKADNLRYRAHIPSPTNPAESSIRVANIPPAHAPDSAAMVEIVLPPPGV
ncbi:MAG: protein kinase [Candidatus Hydrogenedentes bacterium]|nr:protein kinase [Candidatus Hydrogenedentota bacterium]